MSAPVFDPWTQQEFFSWAAPHEGRAEFDGFRPVAMTGGSASHNRISHNIYAALRSSLRGSPCSFFGPDVGVSTINNAIRFPDALVTCTKFPGTERIAPWAVVVFEVLSSDSGRRDRIEKVREYAAVPSIHRYVIVEATGVGLTVLQRQNADEACSVMTLTDDDTQPMPEIGIEIPVAAFCEDVDFTAETASGS